MRGKSVNPETRAMRFPSTFVLLATALAPSIGAAQFSYNTIEISIVDVEVGAPAIDGDGYEIGGSFEINERFFAFGSYQDQALDFGIDGSALSIGGGFRDELSNRFDFVATAALVSAEFEALGVSFDDDGLGVAGGIRAGIADKFQVDAMMNWVDLDDSGSDSFISLSGRYYFNRTLAAFARTNFGEDNADSLQLGVRFDFR